MIVNYLNKIFALFAKYNFEIYLAGGSARDFLLNKDFKDFDFATPITSNQLIEALNITNYDSFAIKFGTLKCHLFENDVEITTFRKEGEYKDFRRPSSISFVSSIEEDSKRRDFTINAIYIDKGYKIYDFHDGVNDLNNKIIRMIGDPYIRLKEDPVRILRALRFKTNLNFEIDPYLMEAMEKNKIYLQKISKDRLNLELNKFKHLKYYNEFMSDN